MWLLGCQKFGLIRGCLVFDIQEVFQSPPSFSFLFSHLFLSILAFFIQTILLFLSHTSSLSLTHFLSFSLSLSHSLSLFLSHTLADLPHYLSFSTDHYYSFFTFSDPFVPKRASLHYTMTIVLSQTNVFPNLYLSLSPAHFLLVSIFLNSLRCLSALFSLSLYFSDILSLALRPLKK